MTAGSVDDRWGIRMRADRFWAYQPRLKEHVELIFVNDGSREEAALTLRSLVDRFDFVKVINLSSLDARQRTIARPTELGVNAVFHCQPLHLSELGRRFGGKPGACPVTEDASDRLLRLPFFNAMTEDQQARVVGALRKSI